MFKHSNVNLLFFIDNKSTHKCKGQQTANEIYVTPVEKKYVDYIFWSIFGV